MLCLTSTGSSLNLDSIQLTLLCFSCLYRLRERNPSDLPNPIPPGCDREERKKRVEKEGGRRSEEKDRRERRREERLEPEHEWRRRKERENKENLHREQRQINNRARENKEKGVEAGRQMRRGHISHKREWRESFAIKKDEMEVTVDSNGFSNADISVNGGRGQSFRREKRKMSSKESMVEQGKVSSPRLENMESSSSRCYTSQERGEI